MSLEKLLDVLRALPEERGECFERCRGHDGPPSGSGASTK